MVTDINSVEKVAEKQEQEKKCQICKEFKQLEDFSKTSRGTFGRVAYCKLCMKEYQKMYISLPRNRKAQNARMRKYRLIHLEFCRERDRGYQQKVRLHALQKIAGSKEVVCVNCNCDDVRCLEINHKNGGGKNLDHTNKNAKRFYLDIISGVRKIDDLEVLCKVCNSLHYLELKFGNLPFAIKWGVFTD